MSEARADAPVVAAFDFDGTLTRRDTLLPFLLHRFGAATLARQALMLSPTLARYALGLIDNGIAKEHVFVRLLAGTKVDELQQQSERFSVDILPSLLRDTAMRRFEWHKQCGHRCVVISASIDTYVRPWAIRAGFDDVIATRRELQKNGCTTAKLSGATCSGVEKVRRLEALVGAREGYRLYAYGNSLGDRELLSFADFPYYRVFPTL